MVTAIYVDFPPGFVVLCIQKLHKTSKIIIVTIYYGIHVNSPLLEIK